LVILLGENVAVGVQLKDVIGFAIVGHNGAKLNLEVWEKGPYTRKRFVDLWKKGIKGGANEDVKRTPSSKGSP